MLPHRYLSRRSVTLRHNDEGEDEDEGNLEADVWPGRKGTGGGALCPASEGHPTSPDKQMPATTAHPTAAAHVLGRLLQF